MINKAQIVKYIKDKNYTVDEEEKSAVPFFKIKMPNSLKDFTRFYETLDLKDLSFLKRKAKLINDRIERDERLLAIYWAESNKSYDSESAKFSIEGRDYGECVQSIVDKRHYVDNIEDLGSLEE